MRSLLITLLLLTAGGSFARAVESGPACSAEACGQSCRDSAAKCSAPCKLCGVIEPILCLTRPGADCLCLSHKCATPLYPCGEICFPVACHKLPEPCDPGGEVCIPPTCHKPAIPLLVRFCRECQPRLSGSRDLIDSGCGNCDGSSVDGWSD